jgi:hypothetical protein
MKPTNISIPKHPLRVTAEGIKHLSSLPQFQGVADETLIRLAELRTNLHVADRWVAIALILNNHIPIPVPGSKPLPRRRGRKATNSTGFQLIRGGRYVE